MSHSSSCPRSGFGFPPRSLAVAFTVGLSSLVVTSSAAAERKALNVLFIVVDDLNTNLGCYGHPIVKSPNIDRLAARGVRFDRAYSQYPLCKPSRTSFLSGRRPETTGVFDNRTSPRAALKDAVFLPEQFGKHGYFTARIGKMAHGGQFEKSVAWNVSENAQGRPGASRPKQLAPVQPAKEPWFIGQLRLSGPVDDKDEDRPDGNSARRAVELLEQNRGKPFFLAVGFQKPHLPFVAPRGYFDLYPADNIVLPANPVDDRKDIPPVALSNPSLDLDLTSEESRHAITAYYACVSFVDAQVGIILGALERLNLAANTVVVLFGDHGFHLGEHGLWQKESLFEESARVPLIVAAPGGKTGAVSSRLVELVDLYPALLELCSLPRVNGLEGKSFVPLLAEPDLTWKEAAYTTVKRAAGGFGRSVRTERYRYTEWESEGGAELYDHQTDPRECTNLANDPKHEATREALRRLLTGALAGR